MDRTSSQSSFDVVLMWRGNVRAPESPTNHSGRLGPLMAALLAEGIEPSPLVYYDDAADAARARLLAADGVLVWINPLQDGEDRRHADALLRDVAAAGVLVSAHPDTILKMGTKEVVYRTQGFGWGSDTDLYESHKDFSLRFPVRLPVSGARVLKPLRGNDGQGVLKVTPHGGGAVAVQHAADDRVETLPLAAFLARMEGAFAGGARMIDQAFQPHVGAGMVRCYMTGARVAGFSEQKPRGEETRPGAPAFGMNSAKTMFAADAPQFAQLRRLMENDWAPGLMRELGLGAGDLPVVWDADFLWRAEDDAMLPVSPWALCEINVSSVLPFPEAAAAAIAASVKAWLERRRVR